MRTAEVYQLLPAHGARRALERSDDLRRDPPAVEVAVHRRHALAVDPAGVEPTGIEGEVAADRLEPGRRIPIAPCRGRSPGLADHDVEVVGLSLPLAERPVQGRLESVE